MELVKEMSTLSQVALLTLPDGRRVELPVLEPSVGTPCIDIRKLAAMGVYSYDPGFTSTASCSSAITFIDGPAGVLLHRGYRIEDLASNCSYLEVCYLLLNGELPTSAALRQFNAAVKSHMMLHERLRSFFQGYKEGAHPMAILVGVVGSLSAFYDSHDDHAITTIRVIAKMPTIAAMAYKHSIGQPYMYPKAEFSFTENFLMMMFATPFEDYIPPPEFVKALDLIFLLHADHEQNASTSTVRIAGSSDANPLACIAAGIASLWGPMHGGANEAAVTMLREIAAAGGVKYVPEFLSKVKSKECKLMGFGHRVYKNTDPRAHQMKKLCHEVLYSLGEQGDPTLKPLLEVAMALEEAALKDEYFSKRKLFPNVDFYSGITLTAMGFPTSMFTVLFAIGRSAGWVAQWRESVEESGRRISRPRQIYTGLPERVFVSINSRDDGSEHFITPALNRMRSAGPDRGVVHSVRRDSHKDKDAGELSEFSYFS